ncbi:MAG TPA: 1,4-dihydroxy-2-naphthoate polyprenyltransferase [Chitinophagales bacterium]|nr:1,4-dihydroxy-2-naphthoate polyprenyltransferase [Chitinophagales bacterium]
MTKVQSWLYAFRLRTLPLAFSSIITGSSIAFAENREGFKPVVFVLLLVTTLLLQILSNLANDYGDSEKGTDNDERIGPKRAVQQGLLSFAEIKTGIVVTVILSLIAGIALIYLATQGLNIGYGIFFFVLGLGAIAAAIKYTVGKGAYGYMGLGDVFVLLFFGIVGVGGSYYLLAHNFNPTVLLPAFTIGAFASGVLNLNNMRDRESDAKAGKNSLVVKIGGENAKKYHTALIITGFIAAIVYVLLNFTSTMQFLFILTAILFRKHLAAVWRIENPVEFDPLLKQLAIGTFIFSILFAVGIIVGAAG